MYSIEFRKYDLQLNFPLGQFVHTDNLTCLKTVKDQIEKLPKKIWSNLRYLDKKLLIL
jgi:hypothetical protein